MNPTQASKWLGGLEWACLGLVTLGFDTEGARLPRPRRYAGVLLVFLILGLIAEAGRAPARLASAAGTTLTLALLLNVTVQRRLLGKLPKPGEQWKPSDGGLFGAIVAMFGGVPDPAPDALSGEPPFYWKTNLSPGGGSGGGGGGGGAW